MVSDKNPVKVRAGQLGARRRWGEVPRHLDLRDVPTEERRLVVALANLIRSAARNGGPQGEQK